MLKFAPSLLAADFCNLERELMRVRRAGASYLHLDVMDGLFVPNISFGIPVIASLRAVSDLFFDVHLMISDPARYIDAFAAAGADLINFHLEAAKGKSDDKSHIILLLEKIRSLGKKNALTIKPATDPRDLAPYLSALDMVLIMSVEPGFGGQKFMPESLEKVRYLRSERERLGLGFEIEIDGGIGSGNIALVAAAGVDIAVAGSSLFGAPDMGEEIRKMSAACEVRSSKK